MNLTQCSGIAYCPEKMLIISQKEHFQQLSAAWVIIGRLKNKRFRPCLLRDTSRGDARL
jgi:hypothetical protein